MTGTDQSFGDRLVPRGAPLGVDIAASVRCGKQRARDVVAGHLARLAAVNPRINAIVTQTASRAYADADLVDDGLRQAQGARMPLCGVPFTVKDTLQTAGVRTTAGSLLCADNVPAEDATVVARLRRAGAILIGKTNCPEFAIDIHTANRIFGATRNPHDLSRTSGGSSGGDSAAVAAGCAVFGLGTDYGGSIRWPAHCTGLAALRPTAGLVPGSGMVPSASPDPALIPNSMSMRGHLHVVAPIARSVRDLSAVLAVISGRDLYDSHAADARFEDPATVDVGALRCLWMDGEGNMPVRSDLVDAVGGAAAALKTAGISVERGLPPGLPAALGLFRELRAADGMADVISLTRGREELLTPNSIRWLKSAHETTVERFQAIAAQRDALRARLLRFMAEWPIWLMPVASIPAFLLDEEDGSSAPEAFDVDGRSVARYDILACCWAISLLGVPAATVQFGVSREGLPIGVQIVGRPFADHEVLAVAMALEDHFRVGGTRPKPER